MNQSTINILMTGAGAPGAAGIIHCLKQDASVRLTVADADENAVGKFLADEFIQIPKAEDNDFLERLMHICTEKKIQIVFPLVTKELFAFSKNKKAFSEKGISILVSSEDAIRIANNKSLCYQFLKNQGIAVPEFFIARNVDEFIEAAQHLGYPKKDFCFKPSISNGSRGVRIVSNSIDEADRLFNFKPYQLYINYDHAIKILSAKPFPELLLSEYLPGDEYSVDCLAEHGKAKLIVPRLREKMINGISVQGVFVADQSIIHSCEQIVESIGLHGNIGIQLKRSASKEALLLEINPRVQGTIVAALGAGVNLPLLAVKQELQQSISEEELRVRWGTRFSRYWTEVFY